MSQIDNIVTHAKQIRNDIADARKTLRKLELTKADGAAALKEQLLGNVYPLLDSMARMNERIAGELGEIDGAVEELAGDEASFITMDVVELISNALQAGQALAVIAQELHPHLDDLSKERVARAIGVYENAASLAGQAVAEAAEDFEEEEGDETAEDEGDEHEDLTGDETAAAEDETESEEEEATHG